MGQDVPEPFRSDLQQCAAYASDLIGPEPCEAWEIATDWAFNRLGELAPTGFWFGASEGDGACFGFWLSEDWADALEHCGIAGDYDDAAIAHIIQELADLGYDPQNLPDCYVGEAEGYTQAEAGADAAAMIAGELEEHADKGWPFRHIDWQAAWEELCVSDNYQVLQWSHARWLVLSGC
ncbi:MAG: hypothetical protein EBY38_01705 [Flavobacteriaceae bacterium]|nr:hypothetical protein [Flavobacteriaceae bacterium]